MNCKIERKFILFRNMTEEKKKSLKIEFFRLSLKKKEKKLTEKM